MKLRDRISRFIRNRVRRYHPLARGIDSRIERSWVISRTALSNRHHYCYFRIPKCANSTVVRTLARHDPDLIVDSDDVKGRRTKRRFDSLLAADAANLAELQRTFYLFTFVRNPYSRLLSAYLDKIVNRSDGAYGFVRRDLSLQASAEVSFADFVSYLERGGLYANPHWTPQSALLPVPIDSLDMVGRVEKLDTDLPTVIDAIFGHGSYQLTDTRSVGRQDASARMHSYYGRQLAQRVYALYRTDFDTFSYSADSWMVGSQPHDHKS